MQYFYAFFVLMCGAIWPHPSSLRVTIITGNGQTDTMWLFWCESVGFVKRWEKSGITMLLYLYMILQSVCLSSNCIKFGTKYTYSKSAHINSLNNYPKMSEDQNM